MSDYLILQTVEPSNSGALGRSLGLAAGLAQRGHRVTVFLAQNAVLSARRAARDVGLTDAIEAGVQLLADDFSLRERGIAVDQIRPGIVPSPLESVIDRLAAGAKTLWH